MAPCHTWICTKVNWLFTRRFRHLLHSLALHTLSTCEWRSCYYRGWCMGMHTVHKHFWYRLGTCIQGRSRGAVGQVSTWPLLGKRNVAAMTRTRRAWQTTPCFFAVIDRVLRLLRIAWSCHFLVFSSSQEFPKRTFGKLKPVLCSAQSLWFNS